MRILVTGGAGFIGANLVRRLLAEDHHVLVVDDFSTGRAENLHAEQTVRLGVYSHDVTDSWPDFGDVDRVYHLACPASPVAYQRDPRKTLVTAVVGTLNALEFAEACDARFLLASTSETYGDPDVHPQPESYRGNVSFTGPRACYDEGKRAAETLVADAERAGSDVRVARIFNTYGPFMAPDDGRVVTNFVAQALRGQPLTVYGDGSQTRSFCYVDDLVSGLTRLMESPYRDPVNLGNPRENSMRELGQLVFDALEVPESARAFEHRPLPVDDPRQRCPDVSLARRVLDWEPRVTLEEGLRETVNHLKKEISR